MMDSWQVVGFCGSWVSDIPTVKPAVILDPTGEFVVFTDLADDEADLLSNPGMPIDRLGLSVAHGDSTRLPPFPWKPGFVLFLEGDVLEYLAVWQAEQRMWCFIAACREEGRVAFARGDRETALEAFDLARRVSNEQEDLLQVLELESDSGVRAVFAQALQRQVG